MDIIIAAVAGLALGIISAAVYFSAHRKTEKQFRLLQEKLASKEKELETYRDRINEHFSKTAEIFTDLTENYKTLHGFLAEQSQVLCDNPIDIQLINAQTKKVLPPSASGDKKDSYKKTRQTKASKLSSSAEVIHLRTDEEKQKDKKKASITKKKEFAESE